MEAESHDSGSRRLLMGKVKATPRWGAKVDGELKVSRMACSTFSLLVRKNLGEKGGEGRLIESFWGLI